MEATHNSKNIRIDEFEGEISDQQSHVYSEEEENLEHHELKDGSGMENDKKLNERNNSKEDNALQNQQNSEELDIQTNLTIRKAPFSSPIRDNPQDESDDVESEFTYDQLSQQLQKALCKIKSKEKMKTQTFLDRVEYFQKKKHTQLQLRKEEKEMEVSKLSAKQPLTNAHSHRILQQYQPIQQRSEKIIEEKRKKIERQQMEKRMKEEEELQQQMQIKKELKRTDGVRSKEEFLSSMNSWKEQKERKIVALAQQELKSEMNGVTFQPEINTQSKIMVKKIGKVPIQQRQIKPKKSQLGQQCTFQPKLNKGKR